jgi:hypothetical protein
MFMFKIKHKHNANDIIMPHTCRRRYSIVDNVIIKNIFNTDFQIYLLHMLWTVQYVWGL